MRWVCAECGELNDDAAGTCDVCGTTPPSRDSRADPSGQSHHAWTDPSGGQVNQGWAEPPGVRDGRGWAEAPNVQERWPAPDLVGPEYVPDARPCPRATAGGARGLRPVIALAVALVVLLLIGAGYVAVRVSGNGSRRSDAASAGGGSTSGGAPRSGEPAAPGGGAVASDGAAAAPSSLRASTGPSVRPSGALVVGEVTIDAAARSGTAGDAALLAAGRTFDAYFSGINRKEYSSTLAVLDPEGVIDPSSPEQVEAFKRATATTYDHDVVVHAARPGGGSGLRALVTFRSTQDPGNGPRGREAETCTLWTIEYELSGDAAAGYRIVKGAATASLPCDGAPSSSG